MKKLPTNDRDFTVYNGEIFIIEDNSNGTEYRIQWGGCSCYQFRSKGFLLYSFKSNHKYFNPDYWEKACCWYLEDNKLLFDILHYEKLQATVNSEDFKNKKPNEKGKIVQDYYSFFIKENEKRAIPAEEVLRDLLEEACKIIGHEVHFNGESFQYGDGWGESMIPVIVKNKECILTWENSD